MSNPDNTALADLRTALAGQTHARDVHNACNASLAAARAALSDSEAEVARLEHEERSWHERTGRRLSDWIGSGQHGPRPVATADAKATLALATARANVAAAKAAVTHFAQAEADTRAAMAAADRRVTAIKREAHHQHAAQLIQEIAEHEGAINRLRALAGLPRFAAEWHGSTEGFVGALSDAQLEFLQTPPARVSIAELFAVRRHVVDMHTPITGDGALYEEALQHWRDFDRQLDQSAAAASAEAAA